MSRLLAPKSQLTISQACGLFTAIALMVSGLIVSLLSYQQQHERTRQDIKQNAELQLQRLSIALAPSLLHEDRISLNLTLNEWRKGPSINAIRVMNVQRQTLAESGQMSILAAPVTHTISQDNRMIGLLQADIDYSQSDHILRRNLSINLVGSALLAFLAALLAYHLSERYTQYLRQLPDELKKYQTGIYTLTPPPLQEFRHLHQYLSDTAAHIHKRHNTKQALQQFISPISLKPEDPLKYRFCTFLYIKIQNLEVLTRDMPAQELKTLLDLYHQLLSQTAKLYNGQLDRFQEDGIVMMFSLSDSEINASLHCLFSARLFSGLISCLKDCDARLASLKCLVVAHIGPVLITTQTAEHDGEVQEHLTGDTLHWASQLAQKGEENRLLASQEFIQHTKQHNENIQWQKGPPVIDLHGKEQNTGWLEPLPENNQQLIQRQIRHIASLTGEMLSGTLAEQ